MAIARIKKDDTVIVTSGTSAGKTGVVTSVDPKKGTAIVAGVNVHTKAMRRTDKTPGGLIGMELPIKLCKLMPYDPDKIARRASAPKSGRARSSGFRSRAGRPSNQGIEHHGKTKGRIREPHGPRA